MKRNSFDPIRFKQKCKPADFFLCFFLLNITAMLAMLFMTRGQFLAEIVWDARHGASGCDFISHIRLAMTRRPYGMDLDAGHANVNIGASFSPFAYFVYYIIGRMIPEQIRDSSVQDWWRLSAEAILSLNVAVMAIASSKILENTIHRKAGGGILYPADFLLYPFPPFYLCRRFRPKF